MIVDHLNAGTGGGAAIAARRLHQALRAAGVESRLWYSKRERVELAEPGCRPWTDPPGPGPTLRRIAGSPRTIARRLAFKWDQRRSLRGRPPGFSLFNLSRLARSTPWDLEATQSDLLHLHWVAKMIDYPSFFASLPTAMPIVWTLHDMNPLTGGCHHSDDCRAYTDSCGHCPQLGLSGENDLSRRSLRVKRDALRGKNLHIVAPSRWIAACARDSRLLRDAATIRTIHHGLDVDRFAPRAKETAKRALGIDPRSVVVGFGAASIDDRRKGLRHLVAAFSHLRAPRDHHPLVALVFGAGRPPQWDVPNCHLVMVGHLDDARRQADVYSAADLFVVPSLIEVFGLTGLEAMACGTPVVAFACGGIVDYVRPMETGLLAKAGDSHDLARQIDWLIERPLHRQHMGENGRQMVCREFELRQQTARYIELYRELVQEHDAKGTNQEAA
ncbi:MAG: glycosyltransferase [Pirellulales bacterium]